MTDRRSGRFITLEGPEGAGKSAVARGLVAALRADGLDVEATREPGGTRLGERLRDVLLARDGAPSTPLVDAFLFNSARAQLVAEVIEPALFAGRVVVCDRYADSTLAYQGYGSGVDLATLRRLADAATGGLAPDLTLLLDLPVEVGIDRKAPDDHTRFEAGFDLDFHRRVRDGFLDLARREPQRWTIIDAGRPLDAVLADAIAATREVLPDTGAAAAPNAADEPVATRLRIQR